MRLRSPAPRRRRRLLVLGCCAPLALGLAACGNELSHPTTADTEGVYIDAGAITYQVQISRELNQYNIEDREYLTGVNSSPPTGQQEWFAVFLWAKNQTRSNATTSDSFDILDTQGARYYPVAINSQVNPFAWSKMTLKPLGTEPAPTSPASFGPTQGGEVLFKINDSAYSNRPLTLEIFAPGQARPSSVSLDL